MNTTTTQEAKMTSTFTEGRNAGVVIALMQAAFPGAHVLAVPAALNGYYNVEVWED